MSTTHLLIKGKVQGVFYRVSAKEKAEEFQLTGWVKNTPEGNVEALVSGSKERIQQFIDWCKQGPPRAEVTDVIVTEKEDGAFEAFTIIR